MSIIVRHTKKGSKRYAVKWTESGHRKEKWFTRKRDAETYQQEIIIRRAHGIRPSIDRINVTTIIDDYLHAVTPHLAKRTIVTYEIAARRIKNSLGQYKAVNLEHADIQQFLEGIRTEVGIPTANKTRTLLNAAYNHAIKNRTQGTNPVAGVRKYKEVARLPQPLTLPQVEALANAAANNHRDYAIIMLLAFSGLRLSEAFALDWPDILNDHIRVTKSLEENRQASPTKTRAERDVALLPLLKKVLDEYQHQHPNIVFPSTTGTRMSTRNWRNRNWKPATLKAGLPGILPNVLRHTFASQAFAKGMSVIWVQRQLGHTKPSITLDRYSHLINQYDDEHRAKFNEAILRELTDNS